MRDGIKAKFQVAGRDEFYCDYTCTTEFVVELAEGLAVAPFWTVSFDTPSSTFTREFDDYSKALEYFNSKVAYLETVM